MTLASQLLIVLVLLHGVGPVRRAPATEKAGAIVGVVTTASGQTAVGAFVKVRNAERRLTFMVVSEDQGRYRVANLPPGRYEVLGVGDSAQSAVTGPIDVAPGQQATTNVTLNRPRTEASGKQQAPGEYEKLDAWSTHLPKARPQGTSARYTVVEYALTLGANPHDVAVDSKGIAWVSERANGILGRFDPQSHTYTRIAVPTGKSLRFYLSAIAVDPRDTVWMIDAANQRLLAYDPRTQAFQEFVVPEPDPSCPFCVKRPPYERFLFNAIRFAADGSVWGTQIYGNQIVRLDPATKKTTSYPVPSGVKGLAKESGAHPYGMAVDGAKQIWFAQNGGRRVGRLDPQTGQITEYEMPFTDARPRRMAADREGHLWFCLGTGDWADGGKLARIDHRTQEITYFDPPSPNAGPSSPDVDRTRNLIWFSETPIDRLARFDPRTKTFAEFALASTASMVRRVEVDPSRPNRVWFSGSIDGNSDRGYDKIGYVEVVD